MKFHSKYMVILFLVLISLVLNSYSYGISDQYEQLPLIFRAMNDDYLKNDWYVSATLPFDVRFYYTQTMSFLGKLIPLEAVFFIIYVISVYFIALATYNISYRLFKKREISYISTFIGLFSLPLVLGNYGLTLGILIPSIVAIAFAFNAIYLFLRGKFLGAYILAGFATLYQLIIGFNTILLLILLSIFLKEYKKLLGIIFYAIITLFVAVPIFLQNFFSEITLSSREIIYIMGFVRVPEVYLPSEWPIISYIFAFIYFTLFIYSFKFIKNHFIKKVTLFFTIVPFSFAFLSIFFTEFIPWALIYKLGFMRMMIFFKLFSSFAIANMTYLKLKEKKYFYDNHILVILLASFRHIYFIGIVPLYLIYINIREKSIIKKFLKKLEKNKIVYFIIIIIILYAFFEIFKFYNLPFIIFLKYFIFILITIILLTELQRKRGYNISHLIVIILLLFTYSQLDISEEDINLSNLFQWTKNNTQPESIFLIPPEMKAFRLDADRAIVVDFKAPPYKNDKSIKEWMGRIRDVTNNIKFRHRGNRYQEIKEGYNSLNEQDILKLKDKYNFTYVVREKQNNLNFTQIYENEKYIIYNLG